MDFVLQFILVKYWFFLFEETHFVLMSAESVFLTITFLKKRLDDDDDNKGGEQQLSLFLCFSFVSLCFF